MTRALTECSGDRDAAREVLAREGFKGAASDEDFAEAIAIQAIVRPISLSPLDGNDDDWTSHLEAQAVAPRRAVPLTSAGYDLLRERLSLTDTELAVMTAEYGFDGADAVSGARAISEETGLDYDLTRNAQTTLKRKLRKAGADVVRDAMTAAREAAGTPAHRTVAAQRQAELDVLLAAPAVPVVEVAPVVEAEAPAEVEIVNATPAAEVPASETVAAPEPAQSLTANSQVQPQMTASFAAGYWAEAKKEPSGAGQVHTDDQPADDSPPFAQHDRIIHMPTGRWRPHHPGAVMTSITHYATPEAREARLAYLRTPEGKAELEGRAHRMVDRLVTMSRTA
ncbi:hypothetical protein AB2L57_10800 [Microbacterium sp. HA-8]|uniref:hypothetical protein n=1 Tax=Microbacterium sp. HA-8 TaxID=3234200 RepID=UPI0038F785D0